MSIGVALSEDIGQNISRSLETGSGGAVGAFLLKEDGAFLLKEDGFKIELESST